MAFTRLLRNLCRDEEFGPRVVPIIPDEARTFGMDSLFREFEIYASQGQRYEPVDHACCSPTPRPRTARSWRRASPRPASMASFIAGGHALRHPGRADGAVLHLLLDVRLPAGGRPHLGRGRRPGPGLPARRHRRAHHAARRGAPAPGRPQPRAGLDRARLRGLRPRLRLRGGRHRPRRPRAGCTAATHQARTSSTTSPLYNENYAMPAAARRRRPRASSRACTAGPPRPTGPTHQATILFSGSAKRRRPRGPGRAGRALRRRRRAVVGHLLQAAARGGPGRRALEPPAPRPSRRARRWSPSCWPTATGPIVAVTDFMKAVPDQIARWVARARGCPSAPTASAAATPARPCAASSRPTPPTSWSPCSPALAAEGDRRRRRGAEGDRALRHRPRHRPALEPLSRYPSGWGCSWTSRFGDGEPSSHRAEGVAPRFLLRALREKAQGPAPQLGVGEALEHGVELHGRFPDRSPSQEASVLEPLHLRRQPCPGPLPPPSPQVRAGTAARSAGRRCGRARGARAPGCGTPERRPRSGRSRDHRYFGQPGRCPPPGSRRPPGPRRPRAGRPWTRRGCTPLAIVVPASSATARTEKAATPPSATSRSAAVRSAARVRSSCSRGRPTLTAYRHMLRYM